MRLIKQPMKIMNENINLCEILKDCPEGTKFFSYIHGQVEFVKIDPTFSHPIIVQATPRIGVKRLKSFSAEGYYDNAYDGACSLVPSLEQPDWSKWKCPKPKKPKFDPSTLKPFDKVLVRGECKGNIWRCSLFSNYIDNSAYAYCTNSGSYKHCIPYNDETKHLVGTSDEAPEHYRYWED